MNTQQTVINWDKAVQLGNEIQEQRTQTNKYKPNGTREEIKLGILHSTKNGYWVSQELHKGQEVFQVWIPDGTCCVSTEAYEDISLAVARCNFLSQCDGVKTIGRN